MKVKYVVAVLGFISVSLPLSVLAETGQMTLSQMRASNANVSFFCEETHSWKVLPSAEVERTRPRPNAGDETAENTTGKAI